MYKTVRQLFYYVHLHNTNDYITRILLSTGPIIRLTIKNP